MPTRSSACATLADRADVGLRVARNTGTNQNGVLVYSVETSTFIERRNKPA